MRAILLAASLLLATVVLPTGSAQCDPGVVPTVRCVVDTVREEAERDLGIVLGVAGQAISAACAIVFGDPRACAITMDALA